MEELTMFIEVDGEIQEVPVPKRFGMRRNLTLFLVGMALMALILLVVHMMFLLH